MLVALVNLLPKLVKGSKSSFRVKEENKSISRLIRAVLAKIWQCLEIGLLSLIYVLKAKVYLELVKNQIVVGNFPNTSKLFFSTQTS